MSEVRELVVDALMTDGGHHKQWYLIHGEKDEGGNQ